MLLVECGVNNLNILAVGIKVKNKLIIMEVYNGLIQDGVPVF